MHLLATLSDRAGFAILRNLVADLQSAITKLKDLVSLQLPSKHRRKR